MYAYAHQQDLAEAIEDVLFHQERKRWKPATNIIKLPPEPPMDGHRGLFRVTESAIWLGLQTYLGTKAHVAGLDAANMAYTLLHHPEMPIMIHDEAGEVCGKIKRETDKWNQPVVRMYRL